MLMALLAGAATPGAQRGIPYFDVEYSVDGEKRSGRITLELYWDDAEKTAYNFYQFVSGTEIGGRRYKYEGTTFHRIISNFMMQGGDVVSGDGTGSISVYGGVFPDEGFKAKHDGIGKLSMANRGKNTNGSQFFITFGPQPHLDGRHVVFGEVHRECLPLIADISRVAVDRNDRPVDDVRITRSGVLKSEEREFL